jgi:hypothetical protein
MKASSRSKHRTHDLKLYGGTGSQEDKKQRDAGGVGTGDQYGRTNITKQIKTHTPIPLMMWTRAVDKSGGQERWTRAAAMDNKNRERNESRHDEQNTNIEKGRRRTNWPK